MAGIEDGEVPKNKGGRPRADESAVLGHLGSSVRILALANFRIPTTQEVVDCVRSGALGNVGKIYGERVYWRTVSAQEGASTSSPGKVDYDRAVSLASRFGIVPAVVDLDYGVVYVPNSVEDPDLLVVAHVPTRLNST